MKKNLLPWSAAVAAGVTLAISSCAYDPYYSSVGGSYSTGYSSGYGDGYGYGGSNFSTSLFVSTGDPRWGYDPYTYSYYDYRSRRYYDPYLYGYYPVGYRPYALSGVPHPHGWRPGSRYCPPPRTVRDVTVVNYRNRESAYRNTDYSWARQVRQQSVRENSREADVRGGRSAAMRPDSGPSPTSDRGWLNPRSRDGGQTRSRDNYDRETYVAPNTGNRTRSYSRPPAPYNTPVVRPELRTSSPDRFNRQNPRTQNGTPPTNSRADFNRPSRRVEPSAPQSRPESPRSGESRGSIQGPQPATPPPAANPPPANDERPARGEGRGRIRSLGEG